MISFSLLSLWQAQKALHVYALQPHGEINHTEITIKDNLKHTTLEGAFLPQLFIQPRTHLHQPGYQVWVPFRIEDQYIIVSLGFMKEPSVPNTNTIEGTIRFISAPPYRLSTAKPSEFPITVAQLDLPLFATYLNQDLTPYIIILDGAVEQSIQLYSEEQVLKHISYTIQFFLIGLILCFGLHRLLK